MSLVYNERGNYPDLPCESPPLCSRLDLEKMRHFQASGFVWAPTALGLKRYKVTRTPQLSTEDRTGEQRPDWWVRRSKRGQTYPEPPPGYKRPETITQGCTPRLETERTRKGVAKLASWLGVDMSKIKQGAVWT